MQINVVLALLNFKACDNSVVKINRLCVHQSRNIFIHALYLRKNRKELLRSDIVALVFSFQRLAHANRE